MKYRRSLVALLGVLALLTGLTPWAHGQFGAGLSGGPPPVTVEVLSEADGVPPGAALRIAARLQIPEGWHINAHRPLDEFLIPTVLTIEPAEGFSIQRTVYPEAKLAAFSFSEEELAVYEHEAMVGVLLEVGADVAPGDYTLRGSLRYQACNDTVCAPPRTIPVNLPVRVVAVGAPVSRLHEDVFAALDFEADPGGDDAPVGAPDPDATPDADDDWRAHVDAFRVTGRNSGYMNSPAFIQWVDDVESGAGGDSLNAFAGRGALAIILLTLIGGLALNLTPCVLPIIPINLTIIGAGARAGSRARGFALGGVYGLAIALIYGVLGTVAVLTGASFGAINASPWFNLGIAVLFIVLGLAMFDVLMIDFSRFQARVGLKRGEKGSFALAFTMGCVSALLAGACVAPVVIFVILLSRDLYAAGSGVALGLPFLLGLGMALPWPFAGAGLSFLPKPGAWMTRVKYAFGVFILAFAAYYGYLGYELFAERYLLDPEEVQASVATLDDAGWTDSLAGGLERARAENRPVLVDFWATWCKNCLTMNRTTFKDPEVMRRLDDYVKIKYRAQFPDEPPARDVMDRFGVGGLGLPVYVILEPTDGS